MKGVCTTIMQYSTVIQWTSGHCLVPESSKEFLKFLYIFRNKSMWIRNWEHSIYYFIDCRGLCILLNIAACEYLGYQNNMYTLIMNFMYNVHYCMAQVIVCHRHIHYIMFWEINITYYHIPVDVKWTIILMS